YFDMLDARAGKLKPDFGLRRTTQNFIAKRVTRRFVFLHHKTVRRWAEGFTLFMNRMAPAPPPGLMHKWPMRRVHEADHRMVHMAGKKRGRTNLWTAFFTKARDGGRLRPRPCGFFVAEENPDISLRFIKRIGPHFYFFGFDFFMTDQPGNFAAGA